MNKLLTYIFISLIIYSCNTRESDKSLTNSNKPKLQEKLPVTKEIDSTNKSENSNTEFQDSIIGTVFVKNKNGTTINEFPILDSNKGSVLEFATKLFVIPSDNNIKTDTSWIKIKTEVCKYGTKHKYYGYVQKKDVVDSLIADFTVIPIDFEFSNNQVQPTKEQKGKLEFKFSKITEQEFNNYKSGYKNPVIIDSTNINSKDGYFILKINDRLTKFYSNICKQWQNYEGFIKPLNSYQISGCGMDACYSYLINKTTGKTINIDSGPNIDGASIIYVSKAESKFLAYSNGSPNMDMGTFIIIYYKTPGTDNYNYDTYDSYFANQWEIEDFIWVDEQTIAIKRTKSSGYLKGTIINK
jgi:hypothetical protein